MMRGHHDAEQEDDQGWHGVEGEGVGARWLSHHLGFSRMHIISCRQNLNTGVQKVANPFRLDEHATLGRRSASLTDGWEAEGATYQTAAEEHDRDGDMLKILSDPFTTPGSEMLKEDIGRAVDEDDEGLYEFSRRERGIPLAHFAAARLNVPCPPKVGKASHPSSQC